MGWLKLSNISYLIVGVQYIGGIIVLPIELVTRYL